MRLSVFVLLALSQLIWALPKPASLSPRADWYDDGWYTAEVMPEQKPKGTTPEQTPEETTPKQNSDGVNPLYSPERCPNGMLPKMAQVYQGCTTQGGTIDSCMAALENQFECYIDVQDLRNLLKNIGNPFGG